VQKTLILATRNLYKQRELIEMLAPLEIAVKSLLDFPNCPEVEEDGLTFTENAIKKARVTAQYCGLLSLADDSGLEVKALGGQPGIYSARFAGVQGDDEANNLKLLELMKNVPAESRQARFVCEIAVCEPDGRVRTVRGVCSGMIACEPKGKGGFGYDPLFIPEGYAQSFAELAAEEKNRISHRGRALQQLQRLLAGD
jgi:XTP/dITP diphosphohydrolase